MFSLIFIPLVLFIVLLGLTLVGFGFAVTEKALKSGLLIGGSLIVIAPFLVMSFVSLSNAQQYQTYVGNYTGTTKSGNEIQLKLNANQDFILSSDSCQEKTVGKWDVVLYDDYMLHLYLSERSSAIQVSLSDVSVAFYDPSYLGCFEPGRLELFKDTSAETTD